MAAGRQAYVVCPLVGESEKLEVASAEETLERLAFGELQGLRLGMLHGKLPSDEKESTMDQFRRGELDVLVATTVIEVGVDVPNATVMAILDADRFGIAQLHQLRGRVGRGQHASTCWLVTQQKEDAEGNPVVGNPRIEALVATTDGFELAEVDLDLRGEGCRRRRRAEVISSWRHCVVTASSLSSLVPRRSTSWTPTQISLVDLTSPTNLT